MATEDLDIIARRADSLIEDHAALLKKLVALRKEHGLSQAEVAVRMGVSQPTVSGFERYDANPTLSTIRRYALAVGARLNTRVEDDHEQARVYEALAFQDSCLALEAPALNWSGRSSYPWLRPAAFASVETYVAAGAPVEQHVIVDD